MADPERLLMKGSAQALSLDPDRIHGGTSTRELLTSADVGFALAGMKADGYSERQRNQVQAALGHVLGDPYARWDLYRHLVQQFERAIKAGRLPERINGRIWVEWVSNMIIAASELPEFRELVLGGEADAWRREFVPVCKEADESIRRWTAIGMAHVRRRTDDDHDGEN